MSADRDRELACYHGCSLWQPHAEWRAPSEGGGARSEGERKRVCERESNAGFQEAVGARSAAVSP